jgi:flagellar motility protein MotE (MotC chaperone)
MFPGGIVTIHTMDLQTLEVLRRAHPGWRLLTADHAPMIVAFLHATFIEPNVRSMPQDALVGRLDDWLYHARQREPEAYPRSAAQYLDAWADDQRGWLRKYYPAEGDEPWFDITPGTEKAIDWLASLKQRSFVGTESRLMMVFELLRQMTEGSELDPAARIAELEKRRSRIDAEIEQIRSGNVSLMDPTQVKDRFQQMATTARGLLSDFREVEQNFRDLDRDIRERIATWDGSKGALLDGIFGERDAIRDSDQGASFRAFWDLLMDQERQDELTAMLERVFDLPPVRELAPDRRLMRVHYDWLDAGEQTQRTVARVSAQLRRYLDDQAWLENKRIMQLIRKIEQHALAMRGRALDDLSVEIDDAAPSIELPLDRPLFKPPHKPRIDQVVTEGTAEFSADALFEQTYVDKTELRDRIRTALAGRSQVSLREIIETHPLEHGLAEVVAYLSIASEDGKAVIDGERNQTLFWDDSRAGPRQATLPLVIFTR